jgi:D-3-phosphoglycerate dehydrogenase
MNIVIADDYQNCVEKLHCFSMLSNHQVKVWVEPAKNREELIARLIDTEVLVIVRERIAIDEELLRHLPKLRFISLVGRHSKTIDYQACTKYGIPVSHGISSSPEAPAELTLALMLATRRNVVLEATRMKAGKFPITLSHRLGGSTLGIFGLGVIGQIVAKAAHAMGMNILVWGREASINKARELGYQVAKSKEEFFSTVDVLSLHLRYNKDTASSVTYSDLCLMKPTALFINTARAELVESGALERALLQGTPGFAGVDVYENEPILDGNHPLLNMDNVVCMPHLGWADFATFELYFGEAFEQVLRYINKESLRLFNPEVKMR